MADHKSNALQVKPSSPEVKNQEHTPGPWRIEAVSDAVRIIVGKGRQKIILARLCPKQIPETETLANARIMASALDLLQQRDELLSALQAAEAHIAELREAWRSGAIDERDGQGGTRSNRNADVHIQICAAIRRATEGQ